MSSIWMDQYYYVFGFLLLVYVILVVTCAEITIVLNYFQLCSEGIVLLLGLDRLITLYYGFSCVIFHVL